MPTNLNSYYTVYGMGIGIFFKPAAGLAQSLERLTAERTRCFGQALAF